MIRANELFWYPHKDGLHVVVTTEDGYEVNVVVNKQCFTWRAEFSTTCTLVLLEPTPHVGMDEAKSDAISNVQSVLGAIVSQVCNLPFPVADGVSK